MKSYLMMSAAAVYMLAAGGALAGEGRGDETRHRAAVSLAGRLLIDCSNSCRLSFT